MVEFLKIQCIGRRQSFRSKPKTQQENNEIERVMNMEKKSKKRTRKRKKSNPVGVVLMVTVVLLALVLIGIFIYVAVQLVNLPGGPKNPEEPTVVWNPEVTENLSEDIFFANHARESLGKPQITGDVNQMQQLSRWQNMTEAVINYHMQILEEETYGATNYIGNRCLGKTQTRQIDVYSTKDEERGLWYLIKIQDRDGFHSSQYSIAPGIYFYKADGSTPIYTVTGEITGTEKAELLALLNNYLLTEYPHYVEARMGELRVEAYANGSATTAMTLKSESGILMLTGNSEQITGMTANYSENEGDTVYNIVTEIEYGKTFDVGVVDLERQSPYSRTSGASEIAFWDGEEPTVATLEDVSRANEVWQEIHIPEEFSARATVSTITNVVADRQTQIDNAYIVCCQQQIIDGKAYHQITIEYTKRGLAENQIAAGTYVFDDEFIWTDRGVLRVANAPKLYAILQSFGTETYLNANWQTGMCGNLYLESYETNANHSIRLVEKGEEISGHPNYAKIVVDNQYQIEELQTHIRYQVDGKWEYSTDLEATVTYKPEKVQFSLPN